MCSSDLSVCLCVCVCVSVYVCVPVMARRISVAAASLISSEACSLYQAVWGVQIRLGASFRGPWVKLEEQDKRTCDTVDGAMV